MDISSQLTRNPIYFSSIKTSCSALLFCFGRWYWFRKDSEIPIANHAIDSCNVADHIIVQDAYNVPSFFLGVFGQAFTAIKSLFLTREPHINDATFKFIFGQDPRGFNGTGHTAGVIVGSGGIRGVVGWVAHTGIDITAHNDKSVGKLGSSLNGNYVNYFHILYDSGIISFGDKIFLIKHLQTIIAIA